MHTHIDIKDIKTTEDLEAFIADCELGKLCQAQAQQISELWEARIELLNKFEKLTGEFNNLAERVAKSHLLIDHLHADKLVLEQNK